MYRFVDGFGKIYGKKIPFRYKIIAEPNGQAICLLLSCPRVFALCVLVATASTGRLPATHLATTSVTRPNDQTFSLNAHLKLKS